MIDEATLIRRIFADPNNPGPRLVYADWLEEEGRKDRAELVRFQTALHHNEITEEGTGIVRQPTAPEREAMAARVEVLIPLLRNELLAPLESLGINNLHLLGYIEVIRYDRGFVSHVSVDPEIWEHAEELFNAAPGLTGISFVEFEDVESIQELLASPLLARLTTMSFTLSTIEDQEMIALAACPHLTGLRSLDLFTDSLDDADTAAAAIQAILESSNLRNLEHLFLSRTTINPAEEYVVELNLEEVSFPRLKSLEMANNSLYGSAALIAAANLPNLEELNLSGNGNDGTVAAAIADNPALTNLRSLGLGMNHIGTPGVIALSQSPNLGRLEHLNVSMANLTYGAIIALSLSPTMCNLRELFLKDNNLTVAAAVALAHADNVRNLTVLDLAENTIGDEGLQAIALSANLGNLEMLMLDGGMILPQGFGYVGLLAMATSRYLKKLSVLSLSENDFGDDGLLALSQGQFPALTNLNIEDTAISDVGIAHITANRHFHRLEVLNVSNNELGPEGARAIAECPHFATLRTIQMANTGIGAAGAQAIAESNCLSRLAKISALQSAGFRHLVAQLLSPEERLREVNMLGESIFGVRPPGQNEGRS